MDSKKTDFQEQIIQKIKNLRTERGISQLSLSNILDISDGQVGNIESPRFPHKYTLKQIYTFCSFVQYPLENLFLSEEELKLKNSMQLLIKKIIQYDE
jgi:putative transcriptional regulator